MHRINLCSILYLVRDTKKMGESKMADFETGSDHVIASSEYGSKLLLLAATLEKQAQEVLVGL